MDTEFPIPTQDSCAQIDNISYFRKNVTYATQKVKKLCTKNAHDTKIKRTRRSLRRLDEESRTPCLDVPRPTDDVTRTKNDQPLYSVLYTIKTNLEREIFDPACFYRHSRYLVQVGQSTVKWTKVHMVPDQSTRESRSTILQLRTLSLFNVTHLHSYRHFSVKRLSSRKVGVAPFKNA